MSASLRSGMTFLLLLALVVAYAALIVVMSTHEERAPRLVITDVQL